MPTILTPKEFDLIVEYLTAVHNDASYDALVLDRGGIVESGSHDTLLEKNGNYAKL